MRSQVRLLTLVFWLPVVFFPSGASLAGIDGETNLVCATVDVIGCVNGPGCMEGHARDFDLPNFIFIDMDNKLVRATKESGHDQVSPVKNFEKTKSQLILQGVENHRGWNATIDRGNGDMTLTSSGKNVSFMIFGACTKI